MRMITIKELQMSEESLIRILKILKHQLSAKEWGDIVDAMNEVLRLKDGNAIERWMFVQLGIWNHCTVKIVLT